MPLLPDLNELPLDELFAALNPPADLDALFARARDEDLDDVGDVTTLALGVPPRPVSARVVARRKGVVAGLRALPALLGAYGHRVALAPLTTDGSPVARGQAIATLHGPYPDVLAVERPMLNLLGRLSGIATLTRAFVDAIGDAHAQLLDTRKTTPGLRGLEKYAVRCGGGHCHRIGLHDAILIKDNHLAPIPLDELTPFLTDRLAEARRRFALRFVEVEVDTPEQFEAVLAVPSGLIDIVLLDNMPLDLLRKAVERRNHLNAHCLLEASGGVTLETVGPIAATGVDRISAGALTHSAVALDVGLDLA